MTNQKAICPVCGKEFIKKQKNSKCCSYECNQVLWRKSHRKVYEKICPICGCSFKTTNSITKFCSRVCAMKAHSLRSSAYAKKVQHEPRQCQECGGEFIPKSKVSKFCSKECSKAYYARLHKKEFKTKICVICGQKFIPGSPSAKYCSAECKSKAQKVSTKKYAYKNNKNEGLDNVVPAQRNLSNLPPASRRWAKMSWDKLVLENEYYGLRYRDSQIMAEKGTLPEDYGLKKKRKVG